MSKTAVGLFRSREAVDHAVAELEREGFARDDIKVITNPAAGSSATPSGLKSPGYRADAGTGSAVGNTEWLKISGVPDEETETYFEGIRRGSVLVTVTSGDDRADRAAEIMDRNGAVDVDELAEEWMATGWARPRTRAAGRGMSPPRGEGTVQAGRHRYEGGGARVFVW